MCRDFISVIKYPERKKAALWRKKGLLLACTSGLQLILGNVREEFSPCSVVSHRPRACSPWVRPSQVREHSQDKPRHAHRLATPGCEEVAKEPYKLVLREETADLG